MKVNNCLNFKCFLPSFSQKRKFEYEVIGYKKEKFLAICFDEITCLGFLSTEPKNHFWKILNNYLEKYSDFIKKREYSNIKYKLNSTYIQNFNIENRRYFQKNSFGVLSKYSENDQLLKENSSSFTSQNAKRESLQKNFNFINFIPKISNH